MIAALIDNGSLEPAAHRNLRALAAALSERAGIKVEAVSWKHSDRIDDTEFNDGPAVTLRPWIRAQLARGEREFAFVPFFISAQGAIGSWLRRDLEVLKHDLGGFRFVFTPGLAATGALTRIVATRIRETLTKHGLVRPAVIVVDHGGPSRASGQLRDQVADEVRRLLGAEIGPLLAASMEGDGHAHNLPLFADAFAVPGFDSGDVVIAPLFLAPGRHAGPNGDLAQVVAAAEDRGAALRPADSAPLHCHFTELVGTHPEVVPTLADALDQTIATFHAAA